MKRWQRLTFFLDALKKQNQRTVWIQLLMEDGETKKVEVNKEDFKSAVRELIKTEKKVNP